MFDNVKAGQKIADLRKNMGLTQDELASQLNISPQAVSKWENGRAMPELSLLVELAEILGSTIDAILFPDAARPAANANFEHILLPYAPIADFSGRTWPRSMAYPAMLQAVKLFMGLEEHRDPMGRQLNDDTENVLPEKAGLGGEGSRVCSKFAFAAGRVASGRRRESWEVRG